MSWDCSDKNEKDEIPSKNFVFKGADADTTYTVKVNNTIITTSEGLGIVAREKFLQLASRLQRSARRGANFIKIFVKVSSSAGYIWYFLQIFVLEKWSVHHHRQVTLVLNGRAIAAVQKKLKALPKVEPQVSVQLLLMVLLISMMWEKKNVITSI